MVRTKMKKLSLLIVFLISVAGVHAQDEIGLDVQVPRSVRPGQRFEVVFSLKNASVENFKSPQFKGCKVLSGPSVSRSSQMSIISGRITRSVLENRSYVLQAGKKGSVTIPSVSVSVDGKVYKSKKTSIEIVRTATKKTSASVQFVCSFPDEVRSGEVFRVMYKVIDGEGVDFNAGDFKNCKVLAGPSMTLERKPVLMDGWPVREKVMTTYVYVVKAGESGKITLPEAKISVDNKKYKVRKSEIKILPLDENDRIKRFQEAERKFPTI